MHLLSPPRGIVVMTVCLSVCLKGYINTTAWVTSDLDPIKF